MRLKESGSPLSKNRNDGKWEGQAKMTIDAKWVGRRLEEVIERLTIALTCNAIFPQRYSLHRKIDGSQNKTNQKIIPYFAKLINIQIHQLNENEIRLQLM